MRRPMLVVFAILVLMGTAAAPQPQTLKGPRGDDSWGARPHPQYQLRPREYVYRFRIRGFVQADDPGALAKITF